MEPRDRVCGGLTADARQKDRDADDDMPMPEPRFWALRTAYPDLPDGDVVASPLGSVRPPIDPVFAQRSTKCQWRTPDGGLVDLSYYALLRRLRAAASPWLHGIGKCLRDSAWLEAAATSGLALSLLIVAGHAVFTRQTAPVVP